MTALVRRLGAFDVSLIVMGSVIGSGIFRVPSVVAQRLQSPTLMLGAWVAGGIIALFGAFMLGELAARRPDGCGVYVYLRDAFHPDSCLRLRLDVVARFAYRRHSSRSGAVRRIFRAADQCPRRARDSRGSRDCRAHCRQFSRGSYGQRCAESLDAVEGCGDWRYHRSRLYCTSGSTSQLHICGGSTHPGAHRFRRRDDSRAICVQWCHGRNVYEQQRPRAPIARFRWGCGVEYRPLSFSTYWSVPCVFACLVAPV